MWHANVCPCCLWPRRLKLVFLPDTTIYSRIDGGVCLCVVRWQRQSAEVETRPERNRDPRTGQRSGGRRFVMKPTALWCAHSSNLIWRNEVITYLCTNVHKQSQTSSYLFMYLERARRALPFSMYGYTVVFSPTNKQLAPHSDVPYVQTHTTN